MASAARTLEPTAANRAEESREDSRTLMVLELAHDTDVMLEDIAARMNCDKARALDFAVALMKLSLDAKENGMRVGAVDSGKELDAEFKGF